MGVYGSDSAITPLPDGGQLELIKRLAVSKSMTSDALELIEAR
jgi:hypothetical protein